MISLNKLGSTDASCFDLLSCIFEIGPSDFEVFTSLKTGKWVDLDSVAESIGKGRTSVFKSLQRLVGLGLVYRESRNLKSGGQYHVYTMADFSGIKKIAQERVKVIESALDSLLEKLDDDLMQKCGLTL
ncbi:MAG: helix-turn-helix domain-containing protein [Thermoplasmataceae archaeon]